MPLRRALVVDDSRVAQAALKKQLEAYDLSVELADTAEAALELLQHQDVDVIFMDHVMPGMDGLDAVKVLKSDPKTATIPVMMYTSKEGEVYVSQARALGAVDVLPKQVQPAVLFGMLLKLGLVRDRRTPVGADADDERVAESAPTNGEDQPVGINLQSLLGRILEDQRSAIRSDILGSHQGFARLVADEVYERQRIEQSRKPAKWTQSKWLLPSLAGASAVLLVLTIGLTALLIDLRADRDATRGDLHAVLEASTAAASRTATAPAAAADDATAAPDTNRHVASDALAWALNESGSVLFESPHFDDQRALQTAQLVQVLAEAGFEGRIVLAAHLGEFCLTTGADGLYRQANPDVAVYDCVFIGHPLDSSSAVEDRQSSSFARFLEGYDAAPFPGIEIDVIAYDRVDSTPLVDYPTGPVTAGEWNVIAELNNRVEYTLLP